jgi:hypothetical protein
MGVIEKLRTAQYVVDAQGQRTAVLLSVDAWMALLNWLEDVQDVEIARSALAEIKAAGGRPERAGWLAWDNIRDEWNDVQGLDVAQRS